MVVYVGGIRSLTEVKWVLLTKEERDGYYYDKKKDKILKTEGERKHEEGQEEYY